MTNLKTLHFYATPEHECSYLEGLEAKTLFVDPQEIISTDAYSQLSDLGFRRSGKHIYRPYCSNCQACISVRVNATDFVPSKSQKRIINKNADLKVIAVPAQYTDEYYELYAKYINTRHSDGDMYPPTPDQFSAFLIDGAQKGCFYEFRDNSGHLVALAVTDFLTQGLSAIYTFFDPDEQRRSLGSYAILWQLQETRRQDLEYLYLGYWIRECQKMAYKVAYNPLEMLLHGQWIVVD
ncbi:arginyltransferase [Amphritea balenae]|uniref:Aspartate/glutamate leucyltransferase n=1 Tax=Amphritea balenae TaxID=452629 RepID=A0A3P1SLM9_9GAMM|nr:arginyltransferase [Amphritea balenae]RRC97910.1 arginyltransferase [Amphritea balenae]GGK81673.1 putative arginyl-tRNA--protein transferase [Amphritea balenae]